MAHLHVVAFEKESGYMLAPMSDLLKSAGYRVTGTSDIVRLREHVPSGNCVLVLSAESPEYILREILQGAEVPPIVLVTHLSLPPSTRSLVRTDAVLEVLRPDESTRLLNQVVTDATLQNLFERLRVGIGNHSFAVKNSKLRGGLLKALDDPIRSVNSMSKVMKCTRRTLEGQWADAFTHAPRLEDFLRGLLLLRAIRIAVREPDRGWRNIAAMLDITASRIRAAAMDFAGSAPSRLDFDGASGAIIARVCAHTVPPTLQGCVFRSRA